jgi:hypothetical protein
MRVALGIAVFSGMLGVTIFGIFFTPVFYVVIRWFSGRGKTAAPAEGPVVQKTTTADGAADEGLITAHPSP